MAEPQEKKARPLRKMPALKKNLTKTDGFAVGVTTSHYWVITALAEGKNSNRMAVLEEIIDYFIQNKLAPNVA